MSNFFAYCAGLRLVKINTKNKNNNNNKQYIKT